MSQGLKLSCLVSLFKTSTGASVCGLVKCSALSYITYHARYISFASDIVYHVMYHNRMHVSTCKTLLLLRWSVELSIRWCSWQTGLFTLQETIHSASVVLRNACGTWKVPDALHIAQCGTACLMVLSLPAGFNIECLSGRRIVRVAAGAQHSLFLTASGAVLACGDNRCSLPSIASHG